MKPNTIFLSKIWALAYISSIIFKCCVPDNSNQIDNIKLIFKWLVFLLPTLFAFVKFGNAILINSAIDKNLNYKKELFQLALFISTTIWLINFFIFTLMMNVQKNHFFTIPFLSVMIIGIYFFKLDNDKYYNDQILDDDLDF